MAERQEKGLQTILSESKRSINSPFRSLFSKKIAIDPILASLAGKPSLSRSARRILAEHVHREQYLHMLKDSKGLDRKFALAGLGRTKNISPYALLFAIAVADTADPVTMKLLKAVAQTSRYSIVKDAARKALEESE